MNHINKSILNHETGLTNANLMRGENDYKSHNANLKNQNLNNKNYSIRSFRDTLLASSFLFFILGTVSSAQQIYDGNASLLVTGGSIAGNFENLIGTGSSLGFIARDDNGEPILNGANAIVDFSNGTTPDFVVVGYSALFGTTDKTTTTNTNTLTLTNGSVNGDIYVGLSHYTDVVASIDCQSMGRCEVKSELSGLDLEASGNEILYNLNNSTTKQGRLNAGVATTRQVFGAINGGSNSNHYAQAKLQLNDSKLKSEKNTIQMNGDKNTINGGLNTGEASINQFIDGLQSGAASDADARIFPNVLNNTLDANANTIIISGRENSFGGSIDAGSAFILQNFGKLQGNDGETGILWSNAKTNNNTLNSDKNTINITGDSSNISGNVNSGKSYIDIKYLSTNTGGLPSGEMEGRANEAAKIDHSSYSNNLNSNGNIVNITGKNNRIDGDINSGLASIKHDYGDAINGTTAFPLNLTANIRNQNQLNSNENIIMIAANGTEVTGSLNAGAAILEHKFGNLSGVGTVHGRSDISSNQLTSNKNTIVIQGNDNSILGGLNAGSALVKQHYSGIQDNASGSIYINSNKFFSNENTISVRGTNNKIKGDLISGHAGIKLGVDDAANINKLDLQASFITAEVNNNKITIDGRNEIEGSIYGGYASFVVGKSNTADAVDIKADTGNHLYSKDNIVTINGSNTINNANSSIYGGYLEYSTIGGTEYKPQKYDVFTGNTLNFGNTKPVTIGTIGNFQTYNFTLNPDLANSSTAMITADQIIFGTNANNTNSSGTVKSDVYVTGIHSGNVVSTGTEFVLMQGNITGEGQGHESKDVKQVQQGISLLYDVETKVDKENGLVTAVILAGHDPEKPEPKVNPQLKSLLEGNLSGLMLLTRQADNIADNTFNVITEQNQHKGLVPFVQASGHTSRYKTGSHIDANGALVTAGLSYQAEHLTAAAFVEYGTADYDTYNSFTDAANVHGKGDNRYYGAGLYGYYDFLNGIYMDASFRGGRLRTKYETSDIRNAATGEAARYTLNGNYMSAHIGTGYSLKLNDANQLNTSLKYLWTQTDSHDVTIAGDNFYFDKLKSNRIRLNAENQYNYNQNWSFLAGLGVEYEFDGKATGKTYGRFDIDAPSVRGFTTIGTLGVRFQPTANDRLNVDFKGNAFLGKREGGNLSVKLKYAF